MFEPSEEYNMQQHKSTRMCSQIRKLF